MLVTIDDPGDGGAVYLRLGALPPLRVPDANDHNPLDWWVVEAITAISADRVVKAWKGNSKPHTNRPLVDTVNVLRLELSPYADDAFATLGALRRTVVRAQFARDRLPALFVGRTALVVQRVRALLEDTFGDRLFTMSKGTALVPAVVQTVRGRVEFTRLDTRPRANGLLVRAIRFCEPGLPPKPADPTTLITDDLIAYPAEWPPLEGISRVPTVRADGTITGTPGYDAVTHTWFAPAPEFAGLRIPGAPTVDDVERARSTLWAPFAEFPFVDGFGPVAAMIFEQLLMPVLGQAVRLIYAIDAPPGGSRTGKTLLAKSIGALHLGYAPAIGSKGAKGSEDEFEKRITSFLLTGEPYHIFDNISTTVDSDALAALCTGPIWRGRILGKSSSPGLPNHATWVLTMNGGRFSKDLAYRVALIRLDAGPNPAKRTFSIHGLERWVLTHRATLVGAALTLIRAWVLAGAPRDPRLDRTRGGFEEWLHVVGGCVAFAGFDGLPAALAAAEERDVDEEDDARFLFTWFATYGTQWLPARQTVEHARSLPVYESILAKHHALHGSWAERQFSREVLARLVHAGRLHTKGPTGHRTYAVLSPPPAPPTEHAATVSPSSAVAGAVLTAAVSAS